MPWTRFLDSYTGGTRKDKFHACYIEAPKAEAEIIFYNRFGHNARWHSANYACCGEDYAIWDAATLAEASARLRHEDQDYFPLNLYPPSTWRRRVIPLDEYIRQADVCVISGTDINDDERSGSVPWAIPSTWRLFL